MSFSVIEIITTTSGVATNVTLKESENDARMLYHQILTSAYANPDVTEGLVMIIFSDGDTLIREHFSKVKPEEA